MTKVAHSFTVVVESRLSGEDTRKMLDAMINAGLVHSGAVVESGEGDVRQAQQALEMTFHSPNQGAVTDKSSRRPSLAGPLNVLQVVLLCAALLMAIPGVFCLLSSKLVDARNVFVVATVLAGLGMQLSILSRTR